MMTTDPFIVDLKSESGTKLTKGLSDIRTVYIYELSKEENDDIPLLTKREKEILVLIAEGLTNQQIKEKLFISIDTVDSHRKNLHTKLNVKNTAMLIRYAIEHKMV